MILVTGGAGFIGSAIVAELNARGVDDIFIVDILGKDQRWKNLRHLRYADYMEADDFSQMVSDSELEMDIDAVIHMGACSDTTETDCSYLVKNNYEFSKLLAGWALDLEARFIYASSAATYGDGSQGFCDDEDLLETLRPLNMYGYSKQMFDLWCRRQGLLDKFVGLKYFNVFGPNEYHKAEMRSFVIKAFEQINQTGSVKLFKSHRPDFPDGGQLRDFIYIKDAVDMTLFFLEHPDTAGIFNIGTGKARNWNDLATAVFNAMGRPVSIEYIPMPEMLRDKYQYFTQADISKLRNAGYDNDTTPLEEAVSDYVKNYLMKGEYLGA
ncbi:MAG: ADP-glyceromanno-heptose 6-epimerase [Phycisphaerae bacterium]|nr:ADP-glyceromanno-heptose 6-epimerase [Phycisphaerae bacterium]HOK96594.1 ADP-glyceromanno-heptose 6-epimerase [Anaerohalosphaeraceae bacterium]HOM75924.1 ADP-glyceromanno-heptose 6-epimerase [Anaerohalosphaeraceae bacterium]